MNNGVDSCIKPDNTVFVCLFAQVIAMVFTGGFSDECVVDESGVFKVHGMLHDSADTWMRILSSKLS